jgi:hypothetical protein
MTFVFFAVFFASVLGCFLIFDLVLRVQYDQYRDEWVKYGMPHGFFFRPSESSGYFNSWIAMQSNLFLLGFRTPEWIPLDSYLRKLLWLFRILQIAGFASWVGFVAYGFAR